MKKKHRKGKVVLFISILLGVLFCSGCAQKKADNVSRSSSSDVELGAVQAENYIYVSEGMLYQQDPATGQSVLLCDKEECDHLPYNEEDNPNPSCGAAVCSGSSEYLAVGLQGNRIYAFEDTGKDNEMVLYKKERTKGEWSKIAVLPWKIYGEAYTYLTDGYAYVAGHRREADELTLSVKEESVVLKVDLATGKYEEISTRYQANGSCCIKRLDFSEGILCYENIALKKEYREQDLLNTPKAQWDALYDCSVCLIHPKEEKEEKVDFKGDFSYGEYLCYEEGVVYYGGEESALSYYDIKQHKEGALLEQIESGYQAVPIGAYGIAYEPVGGEYPTKLYVFSKKRWIKCRQKEAKDVTGYIIPLTCTMKYIKVATCVHEEREEDWSVTRGWITWRQYQSGQRCPVFQDKKEPQISKTIQQTLVKNFSGSTVGEPKLDDAYYATHWKGKKVLIWWCGFTVPNHVIAAINDVLVEKGKNYVIATQFVPYYEENYLDSLKNAKQKKTAVDLLITPSQMEDSQEENKYRICVKEELLEPIDDYLISPDGKKLYDTFYEEQWEALRIDGKIYSYDPRTMPCKDAYVFINQEYIDKYNFTITEKTSLSDIVAMAEEVKEGEQNQNFAALYWPMGEDIGSLSDFSMDWLRDVFANNSDLVKFFDSSHADETVSYFAKFGVDDFVTISNKETIDQNPQLHTTKGVKVSLGTAIQFAPRVYALQAVASWSAHKQEALDFLSLLNTDADVATLLHYGVEGQDYELVNGRVNLINADSYLVESPANQWITPPYLLEPNNKEEKYRAYLKERIN